MAGPYLRPLTAGSGGRLAADIIRRTGEGIATERVAWDALEARIDALADEERGPLAEALGHAVQPPATYAGLRLDRPRLMGVINVTPDSFSDGGAAFSLDDAIAQGRALRAAGADILDVGGESSRPGADPVDVGEELRRVIPVVAALAGEGALLSVDTRRAAVMRAACDAGARIVNDVTALSGDADSVATVAETGAHVVLMHMQGEPRTMQHAPRYTFAPCDVYDFLAERLRICAAAGIRRERIAIDPGIGFGKALNHNLDLLAYLSLFHGLGCAMLLGVSRKSFIAAIDGEDNPAARLPGTIAANQAGLSQGVQILRVHDVAAARQAAAVWAAIGGVS